MTNKPMLSVEQEPVAWVVEISGCLKFFEQKKSAENARRRYEKVMDAERMEPFPLFAEHQDPAADHTQCEECKGWGYHENHYEGGGTECGECGGSGNATVAEVMVMPERMKTEPFTTIDRGSKNYKAGYNAAIAEVAKLNGLKT